jgi:hypothetical protein
MEGWLKPEEILNYIKEIFLRNSFIKQKGIDYCRANL